MQRKPGFPVANCSIKMPEGPHSAEPATAPVDDEAEILLRRQRLVNFGHAQWGFNNWSWAVTKQELDFVDFANGKYCAGVVTFVSVSVKSLDIRRENIGYATSAASTKGLAIYKSRKCGVTNALREALLSFGGSVATELLELLETPRSDVSAAPPTDPLTENNQNVANKPTEPKNLTSKKEFTRKDSLDNSLPKALPQPVVPPPMVVNPTPMAKALPMPASLPPAPRAPQPAHARPPPPLAPRPNPNDTPRLTEMPGPETIRILEAPRTLEVPRVLEAPRTLEVPRILEIPRTLEVPRPLEEEDVRAERKRRQRLAQEEFRLKQLMKQGAPSASDEKQEHKNSSSFDTLLMAIQTQDIEIDETESADAAGKRKSPVQEAGPSKRRGSVKSKLDIVTD